MTKRRLPTTECQYCHQPKGNHVHAAHERACKKHPGDDTLLQQFDIEGKTIRELTAIHQVSHSTVESWLKRAGTKRKAPMRRGSKPKVVAIRELSVLEPQRGCAGCAWVGVCRARIGKSRPVLCEAPLEREVLPWYLAGWLPWDWQGEGLRIGY